MSKQESLKLCSTAYCSQDKNGRYYIFDDNTNPVFPNGHLSSKKAWKEFLKVYETYVKSEGFKLKDVKYVGFLWVKDIHVSKSE